MSEETKSTEGQLLIPNARLGYPKLWHAETVKDVEDSKSRYGCQLYIPKSDVATKAKIDKEINRLSKLHWKGVKPKSKDMCLKDGDGEDGDENTAGHWILSAARAEHQGRPQVIDRNRRPLTADDGKPYAGCYVYAFVGLYKPKKWNKIACSLEIVQFSKDGTPFGAAPADANAVMPDLDEEEPLEESNESAADGFDV